MHILKLYTVAANCRGSSSMQVVSQVVSHQLLAGEPSHSKVASTDWLTVNVLNASLLVDGIHWMVSIG